MVRNPLTPGQSLHLVYRAGRVAGIKRSDYDARLQESLMLLGRTLDPSLVIRAFESGYNEGRREDVNEWVGGEGYGSEIGTYPEVMTTMIRDGLVGAGALGRTGAPTCMLEQRAKQNPCGRMTFEQKMKRARRALRR